MLLRHHLERCRLNWAISALLALVLLLGISSAAYATNYGILTGPHVTYSNITEIDSQIFGPPPANSSPTLFGPPVLSPSGSDTFSFGAMNFSVLVADGQFELQDGKLTMDISPTLEGGSISSLFFDEGGAWRVLGPDSDISPDLTSLAEATLLFNDLRITSVDGVSLGPNPIVVTPTFAEVASAQTGTAHFSLTTGDVTITSAGGSGIGLWDITASFDLDAALAAVGKSGQHVTGVSVALDNELFGQTHDVEGLTLAAIDKKHFFINGIFVDPVSEPSTIALILVGGLIATPLRYWKRREKSQKHE